ncbi:MAG TPA: hypothetical protein VGN32_02920, partial [Ktedonobacterales bacterium]|nr:hypothetical protein [Ktedonobacterales bacterium]
MRRPLAVVAQRLSFSSRAGTTHRPWLRTPLARVVLSCALTVCVVVTCALGATLVLAFHEKPASHAVIVTQAVAPSFTAPGFTHAAFARQQIAVDPLFQAYYTNAAGSTQLGAALTPAMPISGGWLQFFTSGALFLPSQSPAISGHWVAQAGDAAPLDESLRLAIQQVLREDPDEVAPLPLLSALMNAGSEEP